MGAVAAATVEPPAMIPCECSFCGVRNWHGDGDHGCCVQARARGDVSCPGCESFKRREVRA